MCAGKGRYSKVRSVAQQRAARAARCAYAARQCAQLRSGSAPSAQRDCPDSVIHRLAWLAQNDEVEKGAVSTTI